MGNKQAGWLDGKARRAYDVSWETLDAKLMVSISSSYTLLADRKSKMDVPGCFDLRRGKERYSCLKCREEGNNHINNRIIHISYKGNKKARTPITITRRITQRPILPVLTERRPRILVAYTVTRTYPCRM